MLKGIGTILAAMGVSKLYRIESVYPIHERLVQGFDESLQDALSVDIGAGNAHAVAELRSAMPDLPGGLITQDLPTIIGAALAPHRASRCKRTTSSLNSLSNVSLELAATTVHFSNR